MHVNELAKLSGVPAHVIRYYTQIELLRPTRDPKNRYRDYAPADVYRVKFIRRAKSLSFTLHDVREILANADSGISPCSAVRGIVKLRARENHERLTKMQRLQARVEEAVLMWETMPDKRPDHQSLCHLIDSVAKVDGDLT